ncbi:MAG: DUF2283 domain-containing protein [Candidatus Hydrogenedentes bacterium]|nr:DUF2283 domain-containing protein [Candidatus Hydrogenedentota bacterium]
MRITYGPSVDAVRIQLSEARGDESDEEKPGVILDYDSQGNVVAIEILDASQRMTNPRSVEFAEIP